MPEGDTLRRTADVLGRALAGGEVVAAFARPGGAQLTRVMGSRIGAVRSQGKHLLIDLDCGLTLHTHLGMQGSWHRYRPREPWQRRRKAAVAVLETNSPVAVCFDAQLVELLDSRAVALQPALASLGPDLLAEPPALEATLARLRDRAGRPIAEVLLDQRAVAVRIDPDLLAAYRSLAETEGEEPGHEYDRGYLTGWHDVRRGIVRRLRVADFRLGCRQGRIDGEGRETDWWPAFARGVPPRAESEIAA